MESTTATDNVWTEDLRLSRKLHSIGIDLHLDFILVSSWFIGMPKRRIESLWRDIGSTAMSFRAAVKAGDIDVLGKILQDDTIDKDELKSRDPDIYAKGNHMYQSWKASLTVPAFSMLEAKDKSEGQSRAAMMELTVVDSSPPVEATATIASLEEDTGSRTQLSRLRRGCVARYGGHADGGSTAAGSGKAQTDGAGSGKSERAAPGNKRRTKKKKSKEALEELADWVCAICRQMEAVDGSDLLLCEGGCRRSFHFYCLGLDQVLPPPNMT